MKKPIAFGLAQAAILLATAAGATAVVVATRGQVISHDMAIRLSMMIVGLSLALQANFIPKSLPVRSARSQAYKRLSGWAFVMSGLAFAAVWAFAPMDIAATLSMAPVAIAMVTVFVVCVSNRIGSTKAAD